MRSLADVVAHEDAHPEVELPWFGHELFTQALGTGGRAGEGYAAARARNLEWAVSTCLEPALDGVDVLVAAAYGPAWKSDLVIGGHAGAVSSWVTTPAAVAGWPIMSVPVGLLHGLPVGMALIARPGEEHTLLDGGRPGRVRWWPPPIRCPARRGGARAGAEPPAGPGRRPVRPRRRPSGCGASPPCRPGCG